MTALETKETLKCFYVQLRAQKDGPWPDLLKIHAQSVCFKGSPEIMEFMIDGQIIGTVTGIVDAWWSEEI